MRYTETLLPETVCRMKKYHWTGHLVSAHLPLRPVTAVMSRRGRVKKWHQVVLVEVTSVDGL